MWIKYFIPEDGDEMSHPNVFQMNVQQCNLSSIKQGFPIPGSFHFRTLRAIDSNLNVWMDLCDDSALSPGADGSIFLKVSRLPTFAKSSTVSSVTNRAAPSPIQENLDIQPPKPVAAKLPEKTEELLKFDLFEDGARRSSTPQAANISSGSTDLLGLDDMNMSSSLLSSTSNLDIFASSSSASSSSSSSATSFLPDQMNFLSSSNTSSRSKPIDVFGDLLDTSNTSGKGNNNRSTKSNITIDLDSINPMSSMSPMGSINISGMNNSVKHNSASSSGFPSNYSNPMQRR